MIIQATDEQVVEMGKLAILASIPMGMGILHYDRDLKSADIEIAVNTSGLYIDYYQGRMVKFNGHKSADGWSFSDEIRDDYQSWKCRYPSYQSLFDAARVDGDPHL